MDAALVRALRKIAAVASLGAAVAACSPDGGATSDVGADAGADADADAPFVLQGHRDVDLLLDATVTDCGFAADVFAQRWGLTGSVDFAGSKASGWLALTSVAGATGPTARFTLGGKRFEGTVDGAAVHIDTDALFEPGGPPEDILALGLDLSWDADEAVAGSATGTWQLAAADMRCDMPFVATVTGGPDTTAPDARAFYDDRTVVLPFEAVSGSFTEPLATDAIALEASHAATLSLARDAIGMPIRFALVPLTAWPTGGSVQATLRGLEDGAGNLADAALGRFAIQVAPDSGENPGFESGLDQWITDPLPPPEPWVIPGIRAATSLTEADLDGVEYTVTPPAGQWMALIDAGRLIGHFAPPPGSSRITVQLGVLDPSAAWLRADGAGFRITAFTDREVVLADGTDLPEAVDPAATFTGFVPLSLALPPGAGAGAGTWLIVEPWGYAPPVHLPRVVVDDLRVE